MALVNRLVPFPSAPFVDKATVRRVVRDESINPYYRFALAIAFILEGGFWFLDQFVDAANSRRNDDRNVKHHRLSGWY